MKHVHTQVDSLVEWVLRARDRYWRREQQSVPFRTECLRRRSELASLFPISYPNE